MTISDETIITLISSDNVKFTIPAKAAKYSVLVSETLLKRDDDDDDDGDGENEDNGNDNGDKDDHNGNDKNNSKGTVTASNSSRLELELPRVASPALEKVVSFLNHYEQYPFPKVSEKRVQVYFSGHIRDEWYTNFMKELLDDNEWATELLFQVKSAANFMDINPLLEMICLWLTFGIAELRTAENIRKYLRLPQMTVEEEEKARKEHPWMFMNENSK